MASIDQMPDFGAPLVAGETMMFPVIGAGSFSVMPTALHLARDAQGQPALALQIVKRADDLSPDGQYAVLDIQIAGEYSLDDALAVARSKRPDATVKPASIDVGYARLMPAGDDIKLPDDLTVPAPFGWACANGARWTRRLDRFSGELIKGALKQGAVLFAALSEFTVLGVAPRAALQVSFEPVKLLEAILAGSNDREIDYATLLTILMRPVRSLPIEVTGAADASRLPEILRDRLFAAYGTLVPAPNAQALLRVRFAVPPPGAAIWDVAQAVVVPRAFTMQFDMLRGLRDAGDPAKLVHETVIPALDVGFRSITVAANLPKNRVGVPAIGARIDVPANPPSRPSGVSETIVFSAPDDEGTFSFKLSPDESLTYSLTCFAVVAAGSMVSQYEAVAKPPGTSWLRLQSSDFPISFTHITASGRLLDLADISGTLSYQYEGRTIEQAITLSKTAPDVAVAVPNDATGASLAFKAAAHDGARVLSIANVSPGRIELDLTSFPEYGPHRIPVSCAFKNGGAAISVDLSGEDGANPVTLTLLPSSPTAMWGYVAQSPFRSGYRHRENAAAWSDIIPATAPLQLEAN